MRPATAVVAVAVLIGLVGTVVVGLGVLSTDGGQLVERWVSETPRDNEVNHHPIGVGPDGRVIVAPVAAVPNAETITDTSCSLVRLDPETGAVLWRASVDAEVCYSHALTQPVVFEGPDANGLSVAVATTEEALVVYDADDGSESFRRSLPSYGYGAPVAATLEVGGVRTDVIVVSTIQGDLTVVGTDGTLVWERALESVAWATPVVADVDGDGRREVVVGTADGTVAFDAAGSTEWRAPGRVSSTAVGSVPGDQPAVLFTAGERTVTGLDGPSGSVRWRVTFDARAAIERSHAGSDGTVQLYVGLSNQQVVALDGETGQERWRTRIATGRAPSMPPPVLGDVDGDGGVEVVAAATDGTVSVLNATSGEELARYERAVPIWTFPTTADLDDDGRDEVLVRYGDGRVVALEYVEDR